MPLDAALLIMETGTTLVVGGIIVLIVLVIGILAIKFASLWIFSITNKAEIGLPDMIGMTLRRVPPKLIVEARIELLRAGIEVDAKDLENHYLAGGRVPNVTKSMIKNNRASLGLTFKQIADIDLAGRNILEGVSSFVTPKVIDCPDPTKGVEMVAAVAKDGIQVKAKARVTVRTRVDRLVGGATEETIIARVGEGVVTTIGSADSHKTVLENPDVISKKVLEKGLDAGTAFEILSIDIADVDIGENIGAKLQSDQAKADLQIAQAKAEERRAMAVAREQEMKALVQENQAKVVLAEAEVPKAIAESFRSGNLGIMDYYRMSNIQADTSMRRSISEGEADDPNPRRSED